MSLKFNIVAVPSAPHDHHAPSLPDIVARQRGTCRFAGGNGFGGAIEASFPSDADAQAQAARDEIQKTHPECILSDYLPDTGQ